MGRSVGPLRRARGRGGGDAPFYFLRFNPTLLRQQMDFWTFERLQHIAPRWGEQLAGYHGPLGAAVGIAVGAAAGLLTRLARRRPRRAMVAAFAILFAFTSDLGRRFAVDLVTWTGWRLHYHFVPGSISDDQISITGMIFGAIAGAIAAGLAMYATRPRPGLVAAGSPADRPGQAAARTDILPRQGRTSCRSSRTA